MLTLTWLIPLLPLASAAFLGLFGRRLRLRERTVGTIACGTVALSFLVSVGAVYEFANTTWRADAYAVALSSDGERHSFLYEFTWIPGGSAVTSLGNSTGTPIEGGLTIKWVYLLDALSSVMVLIITGVGLLIHIFATGYMRGDRGYYRFFAYMNLFMFSMLVLVLGSNFAMLFVGWEGVGLCSYLLIGYYFDREEAANASKKAFIANRIGDFGFLLGMFGVFALFGSLAFGALRTAFEHGAAAPYVESFGQFGLMSMIALGLFVGATGKSAQIPLYVWLPDAMAGPTPV